MDATRRVEALCLALETELDPSTFCVVVAKSASAHGGVRRRASTSSFVMEAPRPTGMACGRTFTNRRLSVGDAEVVPLGVSFQCTIRRRDVEMHSSLAARQRHHLLKAHLERRAVEDDARIGLWRSADRGQSGDLCVVVRADLEVIERRCPHGRTDRVTNSQPSSRISASTYAKHAKPYAELVRRSAGPSDRRPTIGHPSETMPRASGPAPNCIYVAGN